MLRVRSTRASERRRVRTRDRGPADELHVIREGGRATVQARAAKLGPTPRKVFSRAYRRHPCANRAHGDFTPRQETPPRSLHRPRFLEAAAVIPRLPRVRRARPYVAAQRRALEGRRLRPAVLRGARSRALRHCDRAGVDSIDRAHEHERAAFTESGMTHPKNTNASDGRGVGVEARTRDTTSASASKPMRRRGDGSSVAALAASRLLPFDFSIDALGFGDLDRARVGSEKQ